MRKFQGNLKIGRTQNLATQSTHYHQEKIYQTALGQWHGLPKRIPKSQKLGQYTKKINFVSIKGKIKKEVRLLRKISEFIKKFLQMQLFDHIPPNLRTQ